MPKRSKLPISLSYHPNRPSFRCVVCSLGRRHTLLSLGLIGTLLRILDVFWLGRCDGSTPTRSKSVRRGCSIIILVPVILNILIPVVKFLLKADSSRRSIMMNNATFLSVNSLAELQIVLLCSVSSWHSGVSLSLPLPLNHPLMIPTVQRQRTSTPQNIRHNVIQIKLSAIIRNQALYELAPNTEYSGADNEVWSFGQEAYPILVKYMQRREEMRPYVRGLMHEAHTKGTPLMRAMFYAFPKDQNCAAIKDQYMFGSDYLVAPVLEMGARSRRVYLPEGEWRNVDTDERYQVAAGGLYMVVDAPLERIPVFEKLGK